MKPMLCDKTDTIPTDLVNWIGEFKFDGVRAIYKEGKFINRRGVDKTAQFPELKCPLINAVLDGEIVCQNGSFDDTAGRNHLKDTFMINLRSKKKNPVYFMVFDVLSVDGESVEHLPLMERKEILNKFVWDNENFKTSEVFEGQEIVNLWNKVVAEDTEGIVLKRKNSIYTEKRSPNWLKLKNWKEAILEFTNYEQHTHGITIDDGAEVKVNINGAQATEVLQVLKNNGKVECEIQYLTYNESTGKYRFPSFRGLIG